MKRRKLELGDLVTTPSGHDGVVRHILPAHVHVALLHMNHVERWQARQIEKVDDTRDTVKMRVAEEIS